MDNSLLRMLAEEAAETVTNDSSSPEIIIVVGIFVLFSLLVFIYLASCIVIVKQGTRKIVERFGSYNRTLKEGLHIIFRPFDKIAPVPWNILSISERDAYDRNMAKKKVPFYNDDDRRQLRRMNRDLERINDTRANMFRTMDKASRDTLRRRLEKDIKLQFHAKILGGDIPRGANQDSRLVENVFGDTLDIQTLVYKATGRSMAEIVDEILDAENSLTTLEANYREMGIDTFSADPELINQLVSRAHEREALAASVKYYPRHQDPHSRRAGLYPMAENHIQDFVDLRERHIDTSNERVRKLFALKLDTEMSFPRGAVSSDPAHRDYHILSGGPTRFSGVNLITKDNASVGANIVIFFSVTDPFLYYYGVDEPEESLVLLAITTLRNIVSGLTLEEALLARTTINKEIREELDVACNNWGIKANRVEVKEFELGYSMQKAMDDVLIAEREKRANYLRAEGYRRLKDENVLNEHMKLKGYETLEEVSKGSANKVFIPSDLSDFITGAHVVADAFGEAKKERASEAKEKEKEESK